MADEATIQASTAGTTVASTAPASTPETAPVVSATPSPDEPDFGEPPPLDLKDIDPKLHEQAKKVHEKINQDFRRTYTPKFQNLSAEKKRWAEQEKTWAQKEAQYQQQLQQIQSQLHALVGVSPQNQNPEVDAIRQQFGQLYPGLSKLEERAAQIQEFIERSSDLEAQNQHYWESYGRQTMDKLFQHAQESLGAPLTEEGKRQLHASFVGFVQSSPELQARYANDPSLVQEFWQQFTNSFIDPVRRTATATVAGRVPQGLPQDTPAGIPRTPVPQPGNLDDRVAAGWAQYNQNAK